MFIALKTDGSVVSFGDGFGTPSAADFTLLTDPSKLATGVTDLVAVASPWTAHFTAVKQDGSIVYWGKGAAPMDAAVNAGPVTDIVASSEAFAGKLNGEIVAWCKAGSGGNCSELKSFIATGAQIFSLGNGFGAINPDGSLVTWPEAVSHWRPESSFLTP